ncbi:MAG: hypothetical protein MHM6MM_007453 [Cercozoa sp. M6MM]
MGLVDHVAFVGAERSNDASVRADVSKWQFLPKTLRRWPVKTDAEFVDNLRMFAFLDNVVQLQKKTTTLPANVCVWTFSITEQDGGRIFGVAAKAVRCVSRSEFHDDVTETELMEPVVLVATSRHEIGAPLSDLLCALLRLCRKQRFSEESLDMTARFLLEETPSLPRGHFAVFVPLVQRVQQWNHAKSVADRLEALQVAENGTDFAARSELRRIFSAKRQRIVASQNTDEPVLVEFSRLPETVCSAKVGASNVDHRHLFLRLSATSLSVAFDALLTEQKLCFVSSHAAVLTPAIETLRCMIWPLEYAHVCVPLVPQPMLQHVVYAPMPFLCGVLRRHLSDLDFDLLCESFARALRKLCESFAFEMSGFAL